MINTDIKGGQWTLAEECPLNKHQLQLNRPNNVLFGFLRTLNIRPDSHHQRVSTHRHSLSGRWPAGT